MFPPVGGAGAEGLVAVGGDLRPERMLEAYRRGIFPWFEAPPILWFSPERRAVLARGGLRVARRLRRTLRQGRFAITLDADFAAVVRGCAEPRRGDAEEAEDAEDGARAAGAGGAGLDARTWITPGMIAAYGALHRLGFAHSCEAWCGGALVGGVFGVSLGAAFFAESMFHRRRDAGKAALAALVWQLEDWGLALFDCQVQNPHLASLGVREISRKRYLAKLARAVEAPGRRAPWRLHPATLPRRLHG